VPNPRPRCGPIPHRQEVAMGDRRRRGLIWVCAAAIAYGSVPSAVAQQPAALPATPPPAPGSAPADREAELEARLRQMEQQNRKLAEQLDATQRRNEEQMQQLLKEMSELRQQIGAGTPKAGDGGSGAGDGGSGGGDRTINVQPGSNPNIGGAPDQPGGRRSPVPSYGVSGARAEKKSPLKGNFGPGFEFMTEDQEFQLQFHQETQLDYKDFYPHGDQFARSGFVFPRVRAFFNGRVTKPWEYMLSINRGLGAIDILDAYVNYHTDDRFQLKAGRFMTPFNYEQFAIQNMWLIAPERSLFTANLGLNRMLGVQTWGTILDKRLDYAVGVFNGPRNSFEDFNEAKDVISYINARPFGALEEGALLRNLNLGGSFSYGAQENPIVPRAFRTASNASNASAADLLSPPFFAFNPTVLERGTRSFWSAHGAYFYEQLSLFADYNGGILRYAPSPTAPASVVIPTSGFSVAAGYFLTGETIERRTILEPLRPFNLKHGDAFGLGAFELIARYSTMELDRSAFTMGLADPNLWSNRAWILDLGFNWYLTRYIKIYVDWQHTEYGDPVIFRLPNIKQLTNELLWLRLQIYF
jgi:phosphate-selective porin OprO/OprP